MRIVNINRNRFQTLIFLCIAKRISGVTLIGEVKFSSKYLKYSTTLLIKAISEALEEYPSLNSMVKYGSNTKLIKLSDVDARLTISFDMTEDEKGVYSYIIHQSNKKSIQEIYQEISNIKEETIYNQAVYKKIKLLQKFPLFFGKIITKLLLLNPVHQAKTFGSFTVTSMGKRNQLLCIPISGSTFTFTIGCPKTITDSNDNMCCCNLVMVFDHRVLDGIEASNFLNSIKNRFSYHEKQLGQYL